MSGGLLACGDPPDETNNDTPVCESNDDCSADGAQCWDGECVVAGGDSCEVDLDCEHEYEYCGGGTCLLAGCTDDSECAGNTICQDGRCGQGCNTDAQCPVDGEVCNTTTNECEFDGCTPGECRDHEVCDQDLEPADCRPDGSCSTDLHCTRYERSVQDGIDYICTEGTCTEKPPCESDDECGDGEICRDDGSCGGGCRSDEECLLGEFCDEEATICKPGCNSDVDCGDDGICVAQEGGESICETSCDDRTICNAEELPDGAEEGTSMVCRDSYCQFCEDDNECFGIEFCDMEAPGSPEGKGLCRDLPPECPADEFQPNHTQSEAHTITQFPFERTADSDNNIEDLEDGRPVWCKENSGGEWFELTANPGKVIVVEIEYDNSAGGNLDLALVDNSVPLQPGETGDDLVISARPPDEDGGIERIEYGVNDSRSNPLDVAIHVRGSIIDPKVHYRITVDVRDPESCVDDGHEPNNTHREAKPLPGTPDNGFPDVLPANNLEVCGDDVDWYTVDVPANHILEVTLNAPNRLGEVEVSLATDPSTPTVFEPFPDTPGDTERFQYTTDDGGTFLVRVKPKENVGRAIYDIDHKIVPNECNDVAEPNDACPTATEVFDGDQFTGNSSLNICDDNDYYKIVLNPLDSLTVSATYDPAEAAGAMQMTLFGRDRQSPSSDACGNFLLSASEGTVASTGDSQLLIDNYQAELGGEFYILASRFSGERVPYDLDIDVTSGPPCEDDSYDTNGGNDDFSTAVELQAGDVINNGPDSAITGQRICDTNEDWFSISVADGETLKWEIDHDDTNGAIGAALYEDDGSGGVQAVTDANGPVTLDTNGELSVTNSSGAAKTYYLNVSGKDGIPVRNGYWLFTYIDGNGPIDTTCPDVYEDNDVDADAVELAEGSYSDLLICSIDDGGGDWYRTQVNAGETITVTATFDNPQGNPWMHLFQETDLSSNEVQATASGDAYTATYTSARDQYIYYRIDTSANQGDLYTLDVSKSAAPACQDDDFDGNVDHTTAESVEAPGLYMRLMNCDDEADWFAVELNEDELFEAYINYNADRADLDVEIYESDGTTLVDSGDISAQATPPADGDTGSEYSATYYVRVASADPSVSVRLPYDLLLYRDSDGDGSFGAGEGPEDRLCPDAYENNDSQATAADVPAGSYTDLRLCAGNPTDDDYYSVYVPSGATITVEVEFDPANNVNLFLKNEAGTQVDSSQAAVGASTEMVTHENTTSLGAEYTVHVDGGTGTYQTYYTMDVGLAFPEDCSVQFPDQFDPNGDMANAKVPTAGAYDLILCEGTEDWFEVTLADQEELEVNVELRNRLGNIDLELVDSNGDSIPNASAKTAQDIESLVYTNITGASQTLYLRVYPKDGAFMRNEYDMWLAIGSNLPSEPYCADDYERNDTTETAFTYDFASTPQIDDALMCSVEEDWYQVSLNGSVTYQWSVFFNHASDFDLAIEVRDENGNSIADTNTDDIVFSGHSATDDEAAEFSPPSTGTYFLGVKQMGGAATMEGEYMMYFASTAAACPEDSLEPNDTVGAREALTEGVHKLGMCDSGTSAEDFFSITPPSDGTMNLEVFYDETLVQMEGIVNGGTNGLPNMTASTNRLTYSTSVTSGTPQLLHLTHTSGNGPYFIKVTFE
jgi:hypothetical protein